MRCSGSTGSNGGIVSLLSNALGHRGRNRHPLGQAPGGGTLPPIGESRPTGPLIRGTEAKSPWV